MGGSRGGAAADHVAEAEAVALARNIIMSEELMKSSSNVSIPKVALVLIALCCVVPLLATAQAASEPKAAPARQPQSSPKAPPVGARAFDTPQAAADAMVKAAADFNVPELLAILGPEGKDIVASTDTVQDKNNAEHSPRMLPRR